MNKKNKKPKRPPYMTVEEMRTREDWRERVKQDGGTRYQGTTTPELALRYFTNKGGDILECGPHAGMFTKYLLEHGFKKIHAVDFYDAMTFADKKNFSYSIVDMNTEPLPFKDDFFHGVTAWGIGEHMENPYFFMREVHRVIQKDGTFIFALPNAFHVISRLLFLKQGNFPRWEYYNNHITVFTKDTFRKTFLRYFDLVETIYIDPKIQYKYFPHFLNRFLPVNEWFGNTVIYVLRKRDPYEGWGRT